MNLFPHVFHMFLSNFGIGMFVLKLSVLLQVSKKIFGIINKREVQISIRGVVKNSKINKCEIRLFSTQ